jgi:hypothetical protein
MSDMTVKEMARFVRFLQWEGDCLIFNGGGGSRNRHATFWLSGKNQRAHRVGWQLLNENPNLTQGLTLDHLCRNCWCVNPAHLREVSGRENTLAGYGVGANNARKTHCLNGHKFTRSNTYIYQRRDGKIRRHCKICQRERFKKWKN